MAVHGQDLKSNVPFMVRNGYYMIVVATNGEIYIPVQLSSPSGTWLQSSQPMYYPHLGMLNANLSTMVIIEYMPSFWFIVAFIYEKLSQIKIRDGGNLIEQPAIYNGSCWQMLSINHHTGMV